MNRHEATRRVLRTMTLGTREVTLPYSADDGSQPLVVTTPGEYLSEVLKRIEVVGGSANVAVAETRRFSVFKITKAPARTSNSALVTEELNADMSMGMFKIRYTGRRHARFALKGVGAEVSSEASTFAYA